MRCTSLLKSSPGFAATLALALSLSACGGGGGGSSSNAMSGQAVGEPVPGVKPDQNQLQASCTACGALDNSTYAGAGTGVWQSINAAQIPSDVPVQISGLTGQTVTLVFTNESNTRKAMPGLVLRSTVPDNTLVSKPTADLAAAADEPASHSQAIGEFNRSGFARLLGEPSKTQAPIAKSMTTPSATYVVNDQRQVYLYDYSQRTVQLVTRKSTTDGTVVNVWVETGELTPQRITTALATRMQDKFADAGGIYDMLLQIGGPLWGSPNISTLLPPAGQPVDIFLVNFDHNSQPYGMVGYFWALNNFKKGAGELAYSNESLGLFMDTETLYGDGETGIKQVVTAMAHEGMHMQNFYRRGVKMGEDYTYDTWLEEMTALMMEDWSSFNIDPSHNAIRDSRYGFYLGYKGAGSYNCALTEWNPMGDTCESYAVVGSFGGYLNRQLGLDFYKTLLNSSGIKDSSDILNTAIKAYRPASGIGQELRRFTAASGALIPLGAGIADYSMPARNEGGFSLPAIDPLAVSGGHRIVPQAVPPYLEAQASFPVIRQRVSGTYSETVRVPAGTTLSVVIN
jgi:hypothetical protein